MISQYTTIKYLEVIVNKTFVIGGREGERGVRDLQLLEITAKFPFTEPIKWKTPSPAKLLIECNSKRNK